MKGWQIGVLFGLAIGLVQAMMGNLDIASLSVEAGMVRLASTMFGSAVLCGVAATIFAGVSREGGADVAAAPGAE